MIIACLLGASLWASSDVFASTYQSSFGSSGTGSGQFAHPAGIAQLPSGNLWIADAGNDRLQKFNEAGEYKAKFGSTGTGNGKLDRPTDVAIDSKENLWVTDAENSRVQKFDSNGEYLSQFGSVGSGNGQFGNDGPEALAIDSKGNIWVADTFNGRLQKFNDKGEFVKVISSKGSGAGQLGQPTGIDIGPNNHAWVADWQYNRVVEFNEAGEYVRQFGTEGSGNGQFKHPGAVDVDAFGNVWVTDESNDRIQRFSETGEYLGQFGTGGTGAGQFNLGLPMGIFADVKGNIWVADNDNHRVQRWSHIKRAVPSSPVAAYSFDGGEGEVAADSAGNHNGELVNTEWVKGKYGSALYLDGNDDYVEIPDSPELQLTEEFTLEAWVRPDSAQTEAPVIEKRTPGFYSYKLSAGGEVAGWPEGFVADKDFSWEDVNDDEVLTSTAWSYLALTYDGANLRLYVDGELVDSEESTPPAQASVESLFVGSDGDEDFFKGRIDEVRIYDRALSAGAMAADRATSVETSSSAPVAAYSFDAGKGGVAEDFAGEHDGEIEGAEWSSRGRYGSALSFDGENDCVTVADATDLELAEELTLETWVKPRTDSDLPILYKDSWGNAAYALGIGLYSTGNPEGLIGEGVEEVETVVGPENVEEDVWTHLAFTYDGAHMRIYVNGVLAETEVQSTGPPTGEGALSIGCNHLYPENFEGLIDEVRLYDRALSEGEIQADKGAPIQTPSRGPIVAYSFDAGEGELAEDLAGEHDGDLVHTEWVQGKYGGSIYLDGNDDYVEIPDSPELALSEEFTIEAWVRPDEDATWESVIWKETENYYSYALMAGGEEAGVPEGFLAYEPWAWEDVEDEEHPLQAKTWNHLALTYNGANLRLYVNGELVDTEEAFPNNENSEGLLFFGTNDDEDFFNGRIDEVRLYDRALDAGEIAADEGTPVQTPPRLPVAAYSFDTGEGEVAEDLAGEHDGTLENTEWVRGKYGGSIYLDGNDDYVEIPDSPELALSEEFTIEAWVRPDEDATWESVIWKETENYWSYTLMAGGEEAGVPEGALADEVSSWVDVEGKEDLTDYAWSHLAVTFDGANLRLYVNGELVDTETASPDNENSEGLLFFGTNDDEDFFNGRIDEVRLYDRALTGGEIAVDKDTPIQVPPSPPVAAYSFDAGEGEVAEDRAGENDGTLENTEWVKGKYGSAIYLDGNDDYVEIPDSPELQLTEEFTLEGWVRPDGTEKEGVAISKEDGNFYSYQLFAGSREEAGVPEGFLAYEPWAWEDVEDEEHPLQAKTWNHLALTYDGANLRLYVNGELVDTEYSDPAQASEGPLIIGGNDDEEFFKGRIDEVRIYDRALSAGEVRPDITPPTTPDDFEAVFDPETSETEISWNPSLDPPFSDGKSGSGVRDYSYRYRLAGGSWSSWQSTGGTSFGIPETEEDEIIRASVLATDATGNTSSLRVATVVTTPTSVTPEDVGIEEDNEQGDVRLYPEPAYLSEMFDEEEPSLFFAFEEKLCGSQPSPCGKYDGRAAAAYATRWDLRGMSHDEATEENNQNFDYFGGNGGDCTNFVSQALYNGGLRFMRANGLNDPNANGPVDPNDFERGNSSWWSYFFAAPFVGPGATFWYRHYTVTESWVRAEVLREQLLKTELGRVVLPGERLKVGDVIFYNLHGLDMSEANHSQIVVRVGKHRAWVAQHSPGYRQTLRRVLNRNDEPGHKLNVDWTWQAVRPFHTAANIVEE